jgi:hypothetical protein
MAQYETNPGREEYGYDFGEGDSGVLVGIRLSESFYFTSLLSTRFISLSFSKSVGWAYFSKLLFILSRRLTWLAVRFSMGISSSTKFQALAQ